MKISNLLTIVAIVLGLVFFPKIDFPTFTVYSIIAIVLVNLVRIYEKKEN